MQLHVLDLRSPTSLSPAVLAITLACTFGVTSSTAASGVTPPPTPAAITPPAGNTAFLVGHAVGTQGYICLPSGSGASWTVVSSRPQATLFINIGPFTQQLFTH